MNGRIWTTEDEQLLRTLYPLSSCETIMSTLKRRNINMLKNLRNSIGNFFIKIGVLIIGRNKTLPNNASFKQLGQFLCSHDDDVIQLTRSIKAANPNKALIRAYVQYRKDFPNSTIGDFHKLDIDTKRKYYDYTDGMVRIDSVTVDGHQTTKYMLGNMVVKEVVKKKNND